MISDPSARLLNRHICRRLELAPSSALPPRFSPSSPYARAVATVAFVSRVQFQNPLSVISLPPPAHHGRGVPVPFSAFMVVALCGWALVISLMSTPCPGCNLRSVQPLQRTKRTSARLQGQVQGRPK